MTRGVVGFTMSEQVILFVILIRAVPSIANGVIGGVDYVPALLVRAGRNVGASGLSLYRHVILPAALPGIVTGLKQGWAFAWRSLLPVSSWSRSPSGPASASS